MIIDLFIIGLLGGIVVIDTTAVGQFMISLPIFSSVLLGYLFNNVEAGLFFGILMVLPWLKLIPAGGALYHHGNIGSYTAAATCLLTLNKMNYSSESIIFISIIYGIFLSYTAGRLIYFKRRLNEKIVEYNINDIKSEKFNKTNLWTFLSVTISFFSGAFFSVGGALLGYLILVNIPDSFFKTLSTYTAYGIISFLGIGFGIVVSMFFQKKYSYCLLIGLVLGVLLTSVI